MFNTKKSTFRAYYNSKTVALISKIIKNEDLDIAWAVEVDALGDSVIKAKGTSSDIVVLKEMFNMIAPNMVA